MLSTGSGLVLQSNSVKKQAFETPALQAKLWRRNEFKHQMTERSDTEETGRDRVKLLEDDRLNNRLDTLHS